MKKKTVRVLHFIEVVIVFFAIAIFILANPKTLKYLANEVTTTYNLQYKSLSGNILTNIHIKDISYHDRMIAQDANVDFNLLKLLLLQLDIEKIEFSKVDMDNLKTFINSFEDTNNVSKKSSTLPIILNIHNIELNILPYKKDEIEIQKLNIDIKDFYIGSNIDINDVNVDIKSNYFDLSYNGSYKNHSLSIKNMNISKLDIVKIVKLKEMIKSDSESNSTIIKSLNIQNASLSINPYKKGKYSIKSLLVNVKNLDTKDMKKFDAENVKLDIQTNIWNLKSDGYLKDSTYFSKVDVDLNDKYFKKFIPFFDFNSLNPVNVKLKIDKNRLIGDVEAKSKAILTKKLNHDLKAVITLFKTHAQFDFKELKLHFNTHSKLQTKYAEDITLDGDFYYEPKTHILYDGKVKLEKFDNLDIKIKKLLKNSIISFKGDIQGIDATLKSDYLSGDYFSSDSYLKPKISIKSKEFFANELDKNISKDIKLNFSVESSLNYKDLQNSFINYDIASNFVDLKGKYSVKSAENSFVITSKEDSLLKDIDKNINIKNLFPITCLLKQKNKKLELIAKNSDIKLLTLYDIKQDDYNITATIDSSTLNIEKSVNKDLKYKITTQSIKELVKKLNDYYRLPKIDLDGDIVVDGIYKDKEYSFVVTSNWLLYEYAKYKYFFMEKATINAKLSNSVLTMDDFNANAYILEKYRKLFSTKTSTISFNENGMDLDLLLNDSIAIKGKVTENTTLNIYSNYYHLDEPEVNLFLNIDLNFFSNEKKSSLKGKIYLLSGVLKYKPLKSHEVNDEDIVFVNRVKKQTNNRKNFDMSINIMTKKNIKYLLNKNRVIFSTDITLYKEKKDDLKVFGYTKIKDGVYFSDNKKFDLGSGEILFSGKLLNPYLNLKAYYKKDPYDISIMIGGRLESPILNFTSTPYLTQNDILSILLFNTKASSLTNSENKNQNPALSLFGSSFAKGIAHSLGVKLDRIELSTTKEGTIGIELEKRLGRKTTVIYQNDLVQTIKIKYQNTKNIETDLTFSPESSGIDIIYKNEK